MLPDAHLRVLQALRGGAELLMHRRPTRGPYYTLGGRRLSMLLLKELEARNLIAREGSGAGTGPTAYVLTPAGKAVLAGQNAAEGLRLP